MSFFDEREEIEYLVDDPDEFADEDDVIARHLGCPNCGERRVDYLQMLEDAEHDVHCLTCGMEYDFPIAEPNIDSRREDLYQAGIIPPNPYPL